MQEEFQRNWDQHPRRTLCHPKVILKGSGTVTCYLLGKARRGGGGGGGAGKPLRADFSVRSGGHPPRAWSSPRRRSRGLSLPRLPPTLGCAAPGGFRKSLRPSSRAPPGRVGRRLSPVLCCPTFLLGKLQGQKLCVPGTAGAVSSPRAAARCLSRSLSLGPSRWRGRGLAGQRWPRTRHGRARLRLGVSPFARGVGSAAALGCTQRSWEDSGQLQV